MDILLAMLERNRIHATIPFLLDGDRQEAEAEVAKLEAVIARAELEEKAHEQLTALRPGLFNRN